MRDRELWEDSRHGLEIISLCLRYFQCNEHAYTGYIAGLEELFIGIEEDYSCYLPCEGMVTRPVLLLQYYVERICYECGCCGAGEVNMRGSGGNGGQVMRKVNFSPVLDKRVVGGGKVAGGEF